MASTFFISTRNFQRMLTRAERAVIRNSGTDEMGELREAFATGGIDPQDQIDRDLIAAIPGVGPVRLLALVGNKGPN